MVNAVWFTAYLIVCGGVSMPGLKPLPTVFCAACIRPCRFQKAIAEKLKPIEVDPADKSIKAWLTRARNAALHGMTQDIHADVADDEKLTEVRTASCAVLSRAGPQVQQTLLTTLLCSQRL